MNRICIVLVGLVLMQSYAVAQTPSQAPITPPRPIGPPHICNAFNPEGGAVNAAPTMVQFRITARGSVADVAIHTSSGNDALDQMALSCVHAWQYEPAKQNGQPVDVLWAAEVNWRQGSGGIPLVSRYAELRAECMRRFPVSSELMLTGTGITELLIQISNGEVHGKIARSSGSAQLDQNTIACVKSWDVSNVAGILPPFEIDWKQPPQQK